MKIMSEHKKCKHPFFSGIGYVPVVIISIVISLLFSSTTGIAYAPYVFDEAKAVPASRLLAYYDLNSTEMKLYDEFLAGVMNLEPIIRLETPLNTEDDYAMFDKVFEVVLAVHPEIFWLSHDCMVGRYSGGDAFACPFYLIDSQLFCAEYDGRIYAPPSDEEIAAAKAWIERQQRGIARVLEGLPVHSGMTPYELEVAVNDWLCVNITYDEITQNRDTLYGALIEKAAACEGYSASFQYIMRLMGVECLMMFGIFGEEGGETINHAWNAAKLDGLWYQVDVTLNATIMVENYLPSRRYLNRTDEYMSYDHFWHAAGIRVNVPIVCTATEYNYFVMNGQHPIASDEDFARSVTDIVSRAHAEEIPMFELEYNRAYARLSEITDKLNLIDPGLLDDISFYLFDRHIIGVFDWATASTVTTNPPPPETTVTPIPSIPPGSTVTPITPEMPVNPFEDVKGTDWFIDAVIYINDRGLMTGTSISPMLFSPNATLTRGMVVTVLHRIEGSPDASVFENAFSDVALWEWYGEAVRWAAGYGIAGGYGDGRFGPGDNITREQMATILHNYCVWKGIDVSVGEDTNILSFNDVFDVSEWAISAFQWACGAGVIGGKPGGLLDPEGNATRAEFATVLMRLL